MIKLGAKELRTIIPSEEDLKKIKKNPIYIILDNVLDTYNVGAIFRLADAVAARKVILCGETGTPPDSRIKKASINTTEWVTWSYAPTAVEAIQNLSKEFSTSGRTRRCVPSLEQYSSSESRATSRENREVQKLQVVAIEQSERSIPYDKTDYKFPIALVVGNETTGVSKEALEIADQIVEIPMWGVNKSLNVMVSLGIILFRAMENIIWPSAR